MAEAFEEIEVLVEERIAVLTLRRPERLNALGVLMVKEIGKALTGIEKSSEVRALIVTGAGNRAFSAGVDLKERRELSAEDRWVHNRALNDIVQRLARMRVPTIAAINGLTLGGGFEITLACDFRVAADHAEFALPEVGLGIVPGAGGTQRLPRIIGPTRAKELILTARRITASEALDMGVLTRMVPLDSLPAAALTLAKETAKNSPLALAYAKAALDIATETSIEQGLAFETASIRITLKSEDYRIGLAAFADKRAPEFPPLPAEPLF